MVSRCKAAALTDPGAAYFRGKGVPDGFAGYIATFEHAAPDAAEAEVRLAPPRSLINRLPAVKCWYVNISRDPIVNIYEPIHPS